MENSELNSAGKINAGKPIKKYSVLTEVTAQILKDEDDDDGLHLTAACYRVED